jgi:caa(3)-type oxidase subunit IV
MSDHSSQHYLKIWGILVALLVVSVIGPMFEVQALTLITAFGIAVVKAYLVAKEFMHLGEAPKFVSYLMATCLVFMLLFFAGSAPDVMKDDGDNWKKDRNWHYSPPPSDHGDGDHAEAGH